MFNFITDVIKKCLACLHSQIKDEFLTIYKIVRKKDIVNVSILSKG